MAYIINEDISDESLLRYLKSYFADNESNQNILSTIISMNEIIQEQDAELYHLKKQLNLAETKLKESIRGSKSVNGLKEIIRQSLILINAQDFSHTSIDNKIDWRNFKSTSINEIFIKIQDNENKSRNDVLYKILKTQPGAPNKDYAKRYKKYFVDNVDAIHKEKGSSIENAINIFTKRYPEERKELQKYIKTTRNTYNQYKKLFINSE
ncbi:MAG: hypothetical protein KZQ83_17405 [gamma proteobacterium symbiont of Taylorina sp.]|nr:hypothetical protein [gamma proteobacterium symbiont of Taylorina sp.]